MKQSKLFGKRLIKYIKEHPTELLDGVSSDRLVSIIEKQERMLKEARSGLDDIAS